MTKVVLCYLTSGHIETLAEAVANGVRQAGVKATIERVQEKLLEAIGRANRGVPLDTAKSLG